MRLTSLYTVLGTTDVAASRRFYEQHLGFRAVFDATWYVHLVRETGDGATVQLAVMDHAHQTIPEGFRAPARGVLVSLEVEDVDAVYERFTTAGLPVHLPLRDEPFGQRHFISADPGGVLVDVISPIPPSPEFAACYLAGEATPPAP
jgi:catechol 2,3-dioxygenase-like lactoylglutathione lyase family enzyme